MVSELDRQKAAAAVSSATWNQASPMCGKVHKMIRVRSSESDLSKHPVDEWTNVTANPAGALRGTPNSEKYPIQKACVTALRRYHSERKYGSERFDSGPV